MGSRAASRSDTAVSVNGGASESFTQSWVWNDLGNLASVTYPKCTHAGCTAATNRTVTSTYTNGFLTGVTGYASSISYHPNGQVNQVVRANNTTDTWTKDPQNQMRPNKIDAKVTSTGAVVWNSGVYSYDGAGNVVKTGNGYYLYDGVSRIQDGLICNTLKAGGVLKENETANGAATYFHAPVKLMNSLIDGELSDDVEWIGVIKPEKE